MHIYAYISLYILPPPSPSSWRPGRLREVEGVGSCSITHGTKPIPSWHLATCTTSVIGTLSDSVGCGIIGKYIGCSWRPATSLQWGQ